MRVEVPPLLVLLVGRGFVHEGRVVPDDEIADPPFMRIDEAVLGREVEQAEQFGPPFVLVYSLDVRRVIANIEGILVVAGCGSADG